MAHDEAKVYALNLFDVADREEAGASAYVWHLFDRLDDLRPLLRL